MRGEVGSDIGDLWGVTGSFALLGRDTKTSRWCGGCCGQAVPGRRCEDGRVVTDCCLLAGNWLMLGRKV